MYSQIQRAAAGTRRAMSRINAKNETERLTAASVDPLLPNVVQAPAA